MLKKLLWRDIKLSARVMLPLYGIMVMLAIITRICMESIYWKTVEFGNTLGTISILYEIVVFTGTPFILFGIFYKRLFGTKSSFTFTLPVDNCLHIWSKILITVGWVAVGGLLWLLCWGVMMLSADNLKYILASVQNDVALITERSPFYTVIVFMFFVLFTAFLLILGIVSALYAAASWRHRVKKGGWMIPVLIFVALAAVAILISMEVVISVFSLMNAMPLENLQFMKEPIYVLFYFFMAMLLCLSSYLLLRRNYSRCPNID